jgi:hypothetical protein
MAGSSAGMDRYEWGKHGAGRGAMHGFAPALTSFVAGSVNEAIDAVEDWEFPIRVGAEKEEARALRSELGDLIARLPPE